MKTLKNILPTSKLTKIVFTAVMAASLLSTSSCTSKFEEYNTDPNGIDSETGRIDNANIGGLIPQMEESIYFNYGNGMWQYQLQQNLNADLFSGYMMNPTPFAGGQNNSNYALVSGWNTFPFSLAYQNIMAPWWSIKQKTVDEDVSTEFYGAALVLKVLGMHRVTDIFGPIPYSQFGVENNPDYDSQKDVYAAFFADLDQAITLLKAAPSTSNFNRYDKIYAGNFNKWVKLANTLRLRLALRLSKVDPATSKIQAEKALADAGGLLSVKDDICQVVDAGYQHPVATIAGAWGDIRMGADMESILTGYDDPRLPKYFTAADASLGGTYKGIRFGNVPTSKDLYTPFSNINIQSNTPVLLMSVAEAYFLKAEAALRGYAGAGSPSENYVAGVQASFDQYGLGSASAYLADNTSKPKNYVDPVNASNNSTAASTITIKWDDAATNEVKLERIITQKWIAGFPEGQEAWAEYRRTGYPRKFSAANNFSGGTIDSQIGIRRLPFSIDEVNNNAEKVQAAVGLLGGPDNGGTRLYWDLNKGNF